jgi:phenylpyruvate tautomerase PptA (4-oxalocrotonate tautomerase family)
MLNPFLHSKIDFEQQKILISVNLYRQILAKKKSHFIKELDNAIAKLLGKINVHMCILLDDVNPHNLTLPLINAMG